VTIKTVGIALVGVAAVVAAYGVASGTGSLFAYGLYYLVFFSFLGWVVKLRGWKQWCLPIAAAAVAVMVRVISRDLIPAGSAGERWLLVVGGVLAFGVLVGTIAALAQRHSKSDVGVGRKI
jgi:4-hydroxybenzoate polyprenyltransferase